MIDFLYYIYETINLIIGFIFTIWGILGFFILPFLIIYLVYKHRKDKDEIIKILKPVVAFLLFVVFYYLLQKFNGVY